MAKTTTSTKHLFHPQYRADIDGLRAVAVLLVLGFHAFPRAIPAGFVGVDIFFVISGFLISTIIFRSFEENRFSFWEFYQRRIVRIFPALIALFIVFYAIGWFSLFSDEFSLLGKHILAGAGFVSNLVLWKEIGYFDVQSDLKPFLHLWSLGIEEQFYIFWPLILWVAYKFRFNRMALCLGIALISMGLNLYWIKDDQSLAFYSPLSRFWEILAGTILAYFRIHPFVKSKFSSFNFVSANTRSNFGFLLIASSLHFLQDPKPFPGWWGILPTIGACLVISAGSEAWINRIILSHKLMVWIGLISFPLYLWHWPLLSFARILFRDVPPDWVRGSIVILSIILAWLTVMFLERPLRKNNNANKKTYILLGVMTVVASIGLLTMLKDGFLQRFPSNVNDGSIRTYHLNGEGVENCTEIVKDTKSSFCARTKNPKIAVIGDSHGGHLFHGFLNSGDPLFNQVIVIGAGSCQAVVDVFERAGCQEQLLIALDYIQKRNEIEYVFVAGYYGFVESSDSKRLLEYLDGFEKTLNRIKAMGKKAVFVMDPPTLKDSAELCYIPSLTLRATFLPPMPQYCQGAASSDLRSHTEYNKFVEALKARVPDVMYYNPENTFCQNGVCKVYDNGKILYGDFNHLSIYGSRLFVNDMVKFIRNKL